MADHMMRAIRISTRRELDRRARGVCHEALAMTGGTPRVSHAAMATGTYVPFWERDPAALRERADRLGWRDHPDAAERLAAARDGVLLEGAERPELPGK